jgi:hypothetical protein
VHTPPLAPRPASASNLGSRWRAAGAARACHTAGGQPLQARAHLCRGRRLLLRLAAADRRQRVLHRLGRRHLPGRGRGARQRPGAGAGAPGPPVSGAVAVARRAAAAGARARALVLPQRPQRGEVRVEEGNLGRGGGGDRPARPAAGPRRGHSHVCEAAQRAGGPGRVGRCCCRRRCRRCCCAAASLLQCGWGEGRRGEDRRRAQQRSHGAGAGDAARSTVASCCGRSSLLPLPQTHTLPPSAALTIRSGEVGAPLAAPARTGMGCGWLLLPPLPPASSSSSESLHGTAKPCCASPSSMSSLVNDTLSSAGAKAGAGGCRGGQGGSSRGRQQGAAAGGSSRGQQQGPAAGGSSRGQRQGAAAGAASRGQQPGAAAGASGRGQQQGPAAGASSKSQQQVESRASRKGGGVRKIKGKGKGGCSAAHQHRAGRGTRGCRSGRP